MQSEKSEMPSSMGEQKVRSGYVTAKPQKRKRKNKGSSPQRDMMTAASSGMMGSKPGLLSNHVSHPVISTQAMQ